MLRFTRNKLWLTIFLLGLGATAVGMLFLWPRFAFLPVILVFPPIVWGSRRNGGGGPDGNGAHHRGDTESNDWH